MSDSFAALLERAAAPGSTAPAGAELIVDAAAYAQRVLLQGRDEPWHDATAYANHLSQAQALLQPLVALLPLDRLLEHEISTSAELRAAMTARSRPGFATRAVLGDEALKQRAHAVARTAAQTQREPVVLHLPAPLALLRLADAAARPGEGHEFDDDDAENTAVYYSDWLRAFAELEIAAIVFDERGGAANAESYRPILNTAEHYRWPVGLRGGSELRFLGPEAVLPVLGSAAFTAEDPDAAPADGVGILFTEIPADAVPELVLDRLRALRAAG